MHSCVFLYLCCGSTSWKLDNGAWTVLTSCFCWISCSHCTSTEAAVEHTQGTCLQPQIPAQCGAAAGFCWLVLCKQALGFYILVLRVIPYSKSELSTGCQPAVCSLTSIRQCVLGCSCLRSASFQSCSDEGKALSYSGY